MIGIELIAAERQRQVQEEGWSIEQEDGHRRKELQAAAECYIVYGCDPQRQDAAPTFWPWDPRSWKPNCSDEVHNLVKAGALIAAEIDRLQRLAAKGNPA